MIDWLDSILDDEGLYYHSITCEIIPPTSLGLKYKLGQSVSGVIKIKSNMTAYVEDEYETDVSNYNLKFTGTPVV